MNKVSLGVVAAWLQGHAAAGVDLNNGIELPLFLKPQLAEVLHSAVLEDANRPAGGDAFERGGVWHRAVNRVMYALTEKCKSMTAHYEYPHGLGLGDGAFFSFINAVREFHLELPTDEELHAADAERAARAKAERDAAMASQEASRAQTSGEWDAPYDYT